MDRYEHEYLKEQAYLKAEREHETSKLIPVVESIDEIFDLAKEPTETNEEIIFLDFEDLKP